MKRFPILALCLASAMAAFAAPAVTAPGIVVTDNAIQARTAAFKIHTPTDGSNIGGVQPTAWGISHEVPGNPSAIQLYVEGPSWATVMAYAQRPLLLTQPDHIQLDFDATVLDSTGALLETDMMVTVPVPNSSPQTYTQFNMSLQDLYSSGNLMDVNTSGPWINIPGAAPGKLAVGTHHYSIAGHWNLAANTYGLTSVTVDGTTYPVSQSAPGHASTWAPGVSVQFQISNAPLPAGTTWGSTSVVIDNVTLSQFAN